MTTGIDLLPDEVLTLILQYLPRDTSKKALPYLLVCKRWSKIFERILYEAVTVSDEQGVYAITPTRFLKMLDEKIYLSQYVQDIALPLTLRGEPNCTQIYEIIERILPLCKVALPSGHIDKLLPVIRKVANPELRTLEIFGASLIQIIRAYASCDLKELRISQGTWTQQWGEDNFRPHEHIPLPPLSELDIDGLEERKGTMETIHFVRIQATPESLLRFVQWPCALTELHLLGMQDSRCRGQYSLEEVTKIFDVHKMTLRHIRVGIIPRERNDPIRHSVIDVSSYPELRSLIISNRGLFEQQPAMVARRLLAPKIQDVSFHFEPEQHLSHEWPDDFNKNSAVWMEQLINEFCHLRDEAPSTKLPALHLLFNPAVSPREGTGFWVSNGTWPWNYIYPLKEFAADRGVTLTSLDFDPSLSAPPIHVPLTILRPTFRLKRIGS